MLFSGRGGRVRRALVLCDRPGRLRKQRRAADFTVQKGYRSFLAASTNPRFSSFYNIKQHKPDYNRACVVAMGYKKDIFAIFAYEFELLRK